MTNLVLHSSRIMLKGLLQWSDARLLEGDLVNRLALLHQLVDLGVLHCLLEVYKAKFKLFSFKNLHKKYISKESYAS